MFDSGPLCGWKGVEKARRIKCVVWFSLLLRVTVSHTRLVVPHEGVNNERRDDARRGNEGSVGQYFASNARSFFWRLRAKGMKRNRGIGNTIFVEFQTYFDSQTVSSGIFPGDRWSSNDNRESISNSHSKFTLERMRLKLNIFDIHIRSYIFDINRTREKLSVCFWWTVSMNLCGIVILRHRCSLNDIEKLRRNMLNSAETQTTLPLHANSSNV